MKISQNKKIVPTKAVLKVIRKQKGYKSVSLKEISSVTHKIGYGCIVCFVRDSNRSTLDISLAK